MEYVKTTIFTVVASPRGLIVVIENNYQKDGKIIENKYGYFKSSIKSNIRKLKNTMEYLWDFDEEIYNDFEMTL